MSQMSQVKRAMITAVCIALCVVLPMAFHSIQNAGAIFCPMHIPVLLCGLLVFIRKTSPLNVLTKSWASFILYFVIETIALLVVLFGGLLTTV